MNAAQSAKPGKMEARLSIVCLALLAAVGCGVFIHQFQFNPAVIALRPESHQHAPPPQVGQTALVDTTGSGLAPFSPPESFTPGTLYEKINGRADLYLSSGFIALKTQRFAPDPPTGNWMELFIYDMGEPQNAFSVYSMQRRMDAEPADIVPNAYRTANALFLADGKDYLEIIGSEASESLQGAMGELARLFLEPRAAAPVVQAPGSGLFPEEGFQPDTLQLIGANAFGYEELDQIYTATYQVDGHRLTAFVSQRSDSTAASALAERFGQTLLSYGATAAEDPGSLEGAAVIQFFDTYEIIFNRGRYLAGVHEAANLEAASALAQRLSDHLVHGYEND
jgi:hypothetical protein